MISVIIPAFNRERTIGRAIESVINQTYQDWELIIVDDCSKDNTKQIICDYEKKDSRIKGVFLDKNAGACNARNVGIDNARGEYIAFQDSDDDWEKIKLERQLEYLIQKDADIVVCKMKKINEDNIECGIFPKNEYIPANNLITYETLLFQNLISPQNLLVKKHCVEDIKFDKEQLSAQDWEWALRAVKKYKIIMQNEILSIQYFQKDSISMNYDKKLKSFDRIYQLNEDGYKKNPKAEANFWGQYAGFLTFNNEKEKAMMTYKKSLKIRFISKIFIKMILTKFNLYNKK